MRKPSLYLQALLLVSTLAAATVAAQSSQDTWLHIRVEEEAQSESVKVNVPLQLAETVLPMLDVPELKSGKIKLNQRELTVSELRSLWAALKTHGEIPLVEVSSPEEQVQVSFKNGQLYVTTTENSEKTVFVQIPAEVVDALLSGEGEELDLRAALAVLRNAPPRELVRIRDKDSSVRVWTDGSSTGNLEE